jgi:adenine/guanine phosphoribosyltransferase-like PRPP-binding protein
MKPIIPFPGEDLLELGKRCNAVYVCPKTGSERKGPLVAYAGKDGKGRNLVGDIYFNFRRIEVHPKAVEAFAMAAYVKLIKKGLIDSFDTICGIPQGGRTFGQMLALVAGKKFAYADKKPKPTEEGKKQEYTWDLSQFDFEQGERVAIAEDVFNNFQNTDGTLIGISSSGAEIVLLVGALNRSPIYDSIYVPKIGLYRQKHLPVVASIREPYPEYEQDDPAVVADILAGRLEFEVKKNWRYLCEIMKLYSSTK